MLRATLACHPRCAEFVAKLRVLAARRKAALRTISRPPRPIARDVGYDLATETFTFRDRATGVALDDVASLANLVTVVDAASVFEQLSTMETLVDRGWEAAKGDERTVSHLLCDRSSSPICYCSTSAIW